MGFGVWGVMGVGIMACGDDGVWGVKGCVDHGAWGIMGCWSMGGDGV